MDSLIVLNATDKTIILDFFVGSGTTAHAVMNLNEAMAANAKYILVEMAEYFNTVILPRCQKGSLQR